MDLYFLFGLFIEIFLMILLGFTVLGIKWTEFPKATLFIALTTAFSTSELKHDTNQLLYIIIIITFASLLLSIFTDIKLFTAFFSVIIGVFLFMLIEVTLVNIFVFFNHKDFLETAKEIFYIKWIIMFSIVALFLKLKLPSLPNRFKFNSIILPIQWILILVIMLSVFTYVFYTENFSLNHNRLLWIPGFILAFLWGLRLIKRNFEERSARFEKSMNCQYDQDLNDYIEIMAIQRNMTVDHLLKLRMMMEVGKFQNTKKYLDQLIDNISLIGGVSTIRSQTVSGILLAYRTQIEQMNADISFDIQDDLSSLPLTTYELNKLIKNLMQHILESSKQNLTDRSFKLQIKNENEQIQLGIYGGALSNKNSKEQIPFSPYIDKDTSDSLLHSIQSIIDKYQGFISLTPTTDFTQVLIQIPIK